MKANIKVWTLLFTCLTFFCVEAFAISRPSGGRKQVKFVNNLDAKVTVMNLCQIYMSGGELRQRDAEVYIAIPPYDNKLSPVIQWLTSYKGLDWTSATHASSGVDKFAIGVGFDELEIAKHKHFKGEGKAGRIPLTDYNTGGQVSFKGRPVFITIDKTSDTLAIMTFHY